MRFSPQARRSQKAILTLLSLSIPLSIWVEGSYMVTTGCTDGDALGVTGGSLRPPVASSGYEKLSRVKINNFERVHHHHRIM